MFRKIFEKDVVKRVCSKCQHDSAQVREAYVSGGFASRVFNLTASGYYVYSCARCGFSELYARDIIQNNKKQKHGRWFENVLDFLFG